MEKIPRARSHWKINAGETYDFKSKYCFYFSEMFPEFGYEIKNEIFPLFLKLLGNHRKLDSFLSERIYPDSYYLLKKDYGSFSHSVSLYKSHTSNSENLLERDCIKLIDKAHKILNKYKLTSVLSRN